MWKILEPLLKRASKSTEPLKEIQPNLRLELELFGKLKENYVRTLHVFNELLLEYGTDKNQAKLGELQALYSYNSVIDTGKDVFSVAFRLVNECREALKAQLTDAQKNVLIELLRAFESDDFNKLKSNLFLQQRMVAAKDFPLHLADFKHLLEQEGKLLGHELDILTHIQDRLQSLLNVKDPFHMFDANSVAAIIRQMLILLGHHNFHIQATGSTARGTGVPTSDYDILAYVPETEFDTLVDSDEFAKFFNSHTGAYLQQLPEVRTIRFKEEPFHRQFPLGIRQLTGTIIFEGKIRPAELHFMATDDQMEYVEDTSFQYSHEQWIKKARERAKTRFEKEAKNFKEHLSGVYLYELKTINGAMIEMLLRNIRLERLCERIRAICIPWRDGSLERLHEVLVHYGWPENEWQRFIGRDVNFWDKSEMRAQLLAIAAHRVLQKKGAGLDLDDLGIFYPGQTLVLLDVIHGQEYLQNFITQIRDAFVTNATYIAQLGEPGLFLAIKGRPIKIQRTDFSTASMDKLKDLSTQTVLEAAATPKQQLIRTGQNQFVNMVIDLYRDLL